MGSTAAGYVHGACRCSRFRDASRCTLKVQGTVVSLAYYHMTQVWSNVGITVTRLNDQIEKNIYETAKPIELKFCRNLLLGPRMVLGYKFSRFIH